MLARTRLYTGLVVGMAALGCTESALEPEPQRDPVVENASAISPPAVPAGLKVTCLAGPDVLDSASTCPVLRWNGYTYWAFSHIDNRVSLTIVAYDAAGQAVMQWERPGARYVWQITLDATARTVTFHGQSNNGITMSWDELSVLP